MKALLKFSAVIDWINAKLGLAANACVLLACIVSAVNAMVRYAFDISSNAWLELQWYMFAVVVMLPPRVMVLPARVKALVLPAEPSLVTVTWTHSPTGSGAVARIEMASPGQKWMRAALNLPSSSNNS